MDVSLWFSISVFNINDMSEKFSEKPRVKTEGYLDYRGVKLPIAKNRERAPSRESFNDYVEDAFSRDMERIIATAWSLGEPILIEGGTSLGKTRAVKKMCAELGYEVHYQNLNNHTDPADLMGKYTPNPAQMSENDPRYVFADGSVTKALRAESDKIKVLILDEYNAAHPGVIIRLHEVLDAYKTASTVTLTEDGNEILQIERDSLKIIAITNPAGGGYSDREPLDPAQIRRWSYHKLPDELPKETFRAGVLALSGLGGTKTHSDISLEKYTPSQIELIPHTVLGELPGMEEIVPQYIAFHEAAKSMVGSKRIGNNQRQKFTFDDREEPRRVFSYIARFYDGDMGKVMQDALRYFYAGKVLDPKDKAALEEMIRTVNYIPKFNPERRVLGEEESIMEVKRTIIPDQMKRAFGAKMREVLRRGIRVEGPIELKKSIERFTGLATEQIEEAFSKVALPIIPYSDTELHEIKQRNEIIRLKATFPPDEWPDYVNINDLKTEDFMWTTIKV